MLIRDLGERYGRILLYNQQADPRREMSVRVFHSDPSCLRWIGYESELSNEQLGRLGFYQHNPVSVITLRGLHYEAVVPTRNHPGHFHQTPDFVDVTA